MKTINASRYELLGFKDVVFKGCSGWVFSELKWKTKDPTLMIVSKAKYIKDGSVYFLKEDGSIEDRFTVISSPSKIYREA